MTSTESGSDPEPGPCTNSRSVSRLFSIISFIGLFVLISPTAWAVPVQVSEAPDNHLKLILEAVHSAQKSLYINIYEIKSDEIADAIIDRVQAGLHVEMLNEGQPVGGMGDAEIEIQNRIVSAMQASGASGQDRYYVMRSADEDSKKPARRFRFDHAKYTVIDGESLLIGSENYSASSTQSKPGNRGWEVWIHDPTLTAEYLKTFKNDADPANDDIRELVGEGSRSLDGLLSSLRVPFTGPEKLTHALVDSMESALLDASSARQVLSPDSSLSNLERFLDAAQSTIDLELMTFSPKWGNTGQASPLFQATVRAARRGLKIRVLLNDESVFSGGGHDRGEEAGDSVSSNNEKTVKALNQIASDEGLALEARIADVAAMGVAYIHNKGALADDLTLVSSINWNRNSVEFNREAAVVLQSAAIHDYYRRLFDEDWTASDDQ